LSFRRFVFQSLPQFAYLQVTDPAEQQVTVNQKGRTERIHVNLEALYPSPEIIGSEFSLEELRANHRGWLSKVWEPELAKPILEEPSLLDEIPRESLCNASELHQVVKDKLIISRDPILDENGATKEPARTGRGRRMKLKEVNETQISK
jgi:checkpoint serine/threonine-protein kinase